MEEFSTQLENFAYFEQLKATRRILELALAPALSSAAMPMPWKFLTLPWNLIKNKFENLDVALFVFFFSIFSQCGYPFFSLLPFLNKVQMYLLDSCLIF